MSLSHRACQKPVIACRVHQNKDSFDLYVWPDTQTIANDRRGFYGQPISVVQERASELGIQNIDNWQNGFRPV